MAGTQTLAEALGRNTTVAEVDLSYNKLKAGDADLLAEMLEINRTITSLNLASRRISCVIRWHKRRVGFKIDVRGLSLNCNERIVARIIQQQQASKDRKLVLLDDCCTSNLFFFSS